MPCLCEDTVAHLVGPAGILAVILTSLSISSLKTSQTSSPGTYPEHLVSSLQPYITSNLRSGHHLSLVYVHPSGPTPPNHPLQAARGLSKTLL